MIHPRRYSLTRFRTATARCVVRMRRIILPIVLVYSPRSLKRSASIDIIRVTWRDRDGGEQTALKQQRVSLRSVYVWEFNSTVTKYSDYFVSEDTSERKSRRFDNTSRQGASEFLCIKTPLFWGSSATLKIAPISRKCSVRRATNVKFSKNSRLAPKPALHTVFLELHFARFYVIDWLIILQ